MEKNSTLISIQAAQALVLKYSSVTSVIVEMDLCNALDYVLAINVISEIDMPPFRQAAMDGYAFSISSAITYTVVAEIKAGDNANPILKEGEAVRIFTGAPVPTTANAVIMQEKVAIQGHKMTVQMPLVVEMNIRPKGSQIKRGAMALAKGTKIKGAHIGFLASIGITKVSVYAKPSIAIVVTGNELKAAGTPLEYGEIYESNGTMLSAVLQELGYLKTSIITVADDYDQTKTTLKEAIQVHDIVLVTGGVSVGDYDFVGKALKAIGVKEIFYKVKQKPGKPLFFGKMGSVSIFGLPGNPAAALSCFYIYVYPLLKKGEGATNTQLLSIFMPITSDYDVKGDRAQFLKAQIEEDGVQILEGQSSAFAGSFGAANALVFIPEHTPKIKKGERVKTILLPIK
ncbi:molybdenum cofactor synthesis domain protein [Cellulophaga algicola DSM 14237]|uniref:Molybdopterin molybdenumtransferase n=1 Tax=Cellulophaga algicola (strain DSM 14237 / IC166 / ACAM 630) TaxID=688270 RepID=E6X8F5_CELAD|nr:gephyrin-like molybdotransferase Glp [Cellulophaga algicola]ADV50811.1 molybdenum cofactor synthesis domain protein [Cellulophaga algicola DSM 14237]